MATEVGPQNAMTSPHDLYKARDDAVQQHEQMGQNFEHALAPPPPAYTTDTTVVVNQPQQIVNVVNVERPDMTVAIALSCFVFLCCCWPFGLTAFCLAMCALPDDVPYAIAKDRKDCSIRFSVAGIVIGIPLIILVSIYQVHQAQAA